MQDPHQLQQAANSQDELAQTADSIRRPDLAQAYRDEAENLRAQARQLDIELNGEPQFYNQYDYLNS